MRALCFKLSGKTAHFKRPDVNSHTYFTYHHIHKVALTGLLGAVIGLDGYNAQGKSSYPEFYDKFKALQVAIVPQSKYRGVFGKKTQVFNNSVGYASKEQGNNLIVREQWLENVCWKVYINLESDVEKDVLANLEQMLFKGESIYTAYLGKNDHLASIEEVSIVELDIAKEPEYISSLFVCKDIELDNDTADYTPPFMFKDMMPIGINLYGMYEFEKISYTNREVVQSQKPLYQYKEDILYFM